MATVFAMPQASPTMEFGTILSWKVAEGAALSPQDVLAEVETDKAAMEIEIFDKGWLLRILAPAGSEVRAGAPIAIIGNAPDEDISALLAELAAAPPAAAPPAAAPPAAPATEAPATTATPAPAPPPPAEAAIAPGLPALRWAGKPIDPAIMEAPAVFGGPAPAAPGDPGARLRSSPAARMAARARGLALSQVTGSGPRGRITRADVEAYAGPPLALPAAAPAPRGSEQVRHSQMRRTIARRLVQVWQEAPVFTLTACLELDRLVALREDLKEAGLKVSANDLVVAAVARALATMPEVNASWGPDAITRHHDVHVGLAVALDDGLITPVVRNADRLSLVDLAARTADLVARARARKLQPEEYQGSTFTVSNLGMMGIEQFTAILNPPEAGILAIGSLQQEAVARQGRLALAWRMRVTMTCDHRVIDGALGARFLQELRRRLEHPSLLLL